MRQNAGLFFWKRHLPIFSMKKVMIFWFWFWFCSWCKRLWVVTHVIYFTKVKSNMWIVRLVGLVIIVPWNYTYLLLLVRNYTFSLLKKWERKLNLVFGNFTQLVFDKDFFFFFGAKKKKKKRKRKPYTW